MPTSLLVGDSFNDEMKIALLISGSGTTAAAIITACQNGQLSGVEPVCVIASSVQADGIVRVRDLGIAEGDILVMDPQTFASSEAFGEAILTACRDRGVDFIGQYGWMCLTPSNVVEAYAGMMVNQHPGPLDPGHPDFGGAGMFGRRVHCARLLFVQQTKHDFWTEATAQRVAADFDEGAILHRQQVEIVPDDTVKSLATRVLPVEHEGQIKTLQDFANNSVTEWVRSERLIHSGEEAILERVKAEAKRLYPKG